MLKIRINLHLKHLHISCPLTCNLFVFKEIHYLEFSGSQKTPFETQMKFSPDNLISIYITGSIIAL